MNILQLFFSSFHLFSVLVCSVPLTFTNIDYLSFTYDLYQANPSPSSGFDPGFIFLPIYSFQYSSGAKTADGLYLMPDNVHAINELVWDINTDSSAITGTTSYKSSLEVDVEVNGEYGPASFSASTDYKRVEEGTTSSSNLFTLSTGICHIYHCVVDPDNLPTVDHQFFSEIQSLPEIYSDATKASFFEFLHKRGTHYFRGLHMGAKYSSLTTVSKEAWTKMTSLDIKVTAAAKYAAKIELGVKTMTEKETSMGETFEKFSGRVKINSLGAPLPSDGEISTWSQLMITNPMPVKYTLEPLYNLLTAAFLPGITNLNAKRRSLQVAYTSYCSEFLLKNGVVKSCDGPKPDNPIPLVPVGCRMCSSSCGGLFPIDGGSLDVCDFQDPILNNWNYDQDCAEGYGYHHYDHTGIHLCCQREGQALAGNCRFCNSCGGDYIYENGGTMVKGPTGDWCDALSSWMSAYDSQCMGDQTFRPVPPKGNRLCCKENDSCSFCKSCGGNYPNENGAFSYRYDGWRDYFEMRGDSCEGNVQVRTEANGLKLCCKTRGNESTAQ